MEFKLDTHPGHTLHLFLFSELQNSKEILNLLQTGVLQPELAFFNASLIPDTFPLLAAAHKAMQSHDRGSLRTRSIHSELIFNYSGSKHITESLKRCGISDTTSYVLVARFDASPEDVDAVKTLVKGEELDISELPARADQAAILKHYKISTVELDASSLEDAIVCRIAARDAL
ncbi:EKC/KEOPS complex subunit TPRKB/CGI121 [Marchantia polymorpha subsp. ruderalis]|nr:hypothetical protein MARPO_0083s0082 [Marchantia polymorpha]BBN19643.1 hypothetical protein Mp_8g12380 [Marchantia polymorpha subsp. ruderalis]|eukprot:PTQ34124.1 hypothetical protein MARPO_0083s0082 [Marchantia polymorpha]